MVISYSICQKEEKECNWVKYVINEVLPQIKFCQNLRIFSAKSKFLDFYKKLLVESLAVIGLGLLFEKCTKNMNLSNIFGGF